MTTVCDRRVWPRQVRTATFMGRAILRDALATREAASVGVGSAPGAPGLPARVRAVEHLAHLSPSLLAELAPALPSSISGDAFLAK